MKNTLKGKMKLVIFAVVTVLLCTVFSLSSFSANDDFEKQIAGFPESYKPYLRQLHQAHPTWKFEPFFTNLDFNEAVDNECGIKSLVEHSASSDIFKSRDAGDYDASTGKYDYKDGNFVEANRLAVAYFMDPRNFLNEDGIFQFEQLSFNSSFTASAVENVLKGSFMHKANISYYDSKGKLKKTSTKYSTAILNAGKKYNINPCYLASKIRNEIGTSSNNQSISGKHSKYPGIYNFYNIGAYDGAGAIEKGLKWASEGSTYSRPWTTPLKSIEGGAEYLAEKYISKGQFTGYLQRFNVNPNGYYKVYDHQYMTNLTGALSQGYTTYVSYANTGMLENSYVFSIPVYMNMPSENITGGSAQIFDSIDQRGKITASTSFVRTGPSTYNAKLLNKSGGEIKLTSGTAVEIIGKVKTDSKYYASILQYPYWYKIKFTVSGVAYEGYVPEGFVDITTTINVSTGNYTVNYLKSNYDIELDMISSDNKIAQVIDLKTVKFLKAGTVYVTAYDSLGRIDKLKFVVSKNAAVIPTNVSLTNIQPKSADLKFTANASAKGYELTVVNGAGAVVSRNTVTASPYTLTGLSGGTNYTVYFRALTNTAQPKKYGPTVALSLTTIPDKVVISKVYRNGAGKNVLSWNGLSGVSGYDVFHYDSVNKVYNKITTLPATATSYTVPDPEVAKATFAICGLRNVNGQIQYGTYSTVVDIRNIPANVSGISAADVSTDGYTVKWNAVSGAKYYIYKKDQRYLSVDTNSYTVKNAAASSLNEHRISAYKTVNNVLYESTWSSIFTVSTKPAKVANLKATAKPNGAVLKWTKIPAASYYEVYIYKSDKKDYVKKATVTQNTYTLTGRNPGKQYKIRVKAFIKTTFGTYESPNADLSFYTTPGKIEKITVSSVGTASHTLNWSKISGANRYDIYRYNSKKKKYVKIGSTKSVKYTVKDLSAGKTYKYKVRSVKVVDSKTVSYITSDVYSFTTDPPKVKTVKASKRTKSYITLSWSKSTGATKYQIYKYDASKKKYVRVATTEKTSYKVKSLDSKKSYKFKVRAVRTLNKKNYYGSYSSVYTFKTK